MFALAARIQIKPEHRDEFIQAMLADAKGSVENEPGCLGFNIVQDADDPNRLHLFELYTDAAAFEAHKQTPHFKTWLETTANWLAAKPEMATGMTIFPEG